MPELSTTATAPKPTLATLLLNALTAPASGECPVVEKAPEGMVVYDIPLQLRGLVCLFAEFAANHSMKDKDIVWFWKATEKEAVWTILAHSLRIGGAHGKVYIRIFADWKYAAMSC